MSFEVRWRGAAAVAIVALCTAATLVPAGREPIDESYRILVHDGRGDVDPYQVYFFVKAVAQQERLRVCAIFIAEMSDQRFERLPRKRRRAVCVDTDAPWRAEYAAGEFAIGLYGLKSRAQIFSAGRRF